MTVALNNLREKQLKLLDLQEWHLDSIINSFANEDTMTKFLRQKIEAKPTSIEILYAISMKFKYCDNAFFDHLLVT